MTPAELKQHQTAFVNSIIAQVFQLVGAEEAEFGTDFARETLMHFLRQFVNSIVYASLTSPLEGITANLSTTQKHAIVWESYKKHKTLVENAVGEGFTDGFQGWNPDRLAELICQVTLVDTGISEGKTRH